MEASKSKEMYHNMLERLKKLYQPESIKDGQFGAMMDVNIVNDGPVTINLESPAHLREQQQSKAK